MAGHGLDVVPVAVGLQHPAHAEALGQLEQLLVLVGGVEQHGVAGLLAAQHEHVVLVGPDDDLVDLEAAVVDVQRHATSLPPASPPVGRAPRPLRWR